MMASRVDAGRKGLMKSIIVPVSTSILLALLVSPYAHAEGDAVAGKRVFNQCVACHDATAERDRVGPHLVGIIGRTAGSLESFSGRYSADMKAAGEDGLVWDEETLVEYLRNPRAVIPRGTMAFAGLRSDEDIANVIAYMAADPKP
jgi:cytochrome c